MPLATFTVGDTLLSILELAFLFLWIWIAIVVVFDIFRSRDLSNWAKALWMLFIFVLPLLGVFAYLVVRGHTMHDHQLQDQRQYVAFRQYSGTGGTHSAADEIHKLAELKERGVLSEEEFQRAKAKVLD